MCAKKGIKPIIEVLPMKEAGVLHVFCNRRTCLIAFATFSGKAVQNVKDNKVRYRHVLQMDL